MRRLTTRDKCLDFFFFFFAGQCHNVFRVFLFKKLCHVLFCGGDCIIKSVRTGLFLSDGLTVPAVEAKRLFPRHKTVHQQ